MFNLNFLDLTPVVSKLETEELPKVELESSTGQLVNVTDLDEGNQEAGLEGLDLPKPNPVSASIDTKNVEYCPPPAIFSSDSNTDVYLVGNCYSTMEPLTHALLSADSDEIITIELSCPRLGSFYMLGLISAIELSKATVNIVCGYTNSTFESLLVLASKHNDIEDGQFTFTPIKSGAHGTTAEIKDAMIDHEQYTSIVFNYLIDMKVLTEEEVENITTSDTNFYLSSAEVKERLSK